MKFNKVIIILVVAVIFLFSSCSMSVGTNSGSAEDVLERIKLIKESNNGMPQYLVSNTPEVELLKGQTSSQQLSVDSENFRKSCISDLGEIERRDNGDTVAWINDSFMYFKFKTEGDYILPKAFIVYYKDLLDSDKYPSYNENPVLKNVYMAFNGVVVTDIELSDEIFYAYIPKEAMMSNELDVMVMFPDGNGQFYEKGKKIISILGIGLIDGKVETMNPAFGVGYALQSTSRGNLNEKATVGWYAIGDDGTWIRENMKFYFKTSSIEDMNLVTSYDPLSYDQNCKVYFNNKYIGSLSKEDNIILHESDFVSGIQKVEYKIEPAVLESDLIEGGSNKDYVGIKIRSVTIK